MGSGPNFADHKNPRPVIQVGNPGDVGEVEMSDLVITTTGGSAGAIGIEWNLRASAQGTAGLWDVHIRLGGAKGTNINAANCPTSSTDATKCASAFLGLHVTKTGSGYFENVWVWNADHDLDDPNQTQINVFSGRGILVESALGPVWLVGTASEHHVIYQYAFNNAQNVWAGLIQTETPYFQPTPKPLAPFSINPTYGDPAGASLDAWGLVVTNSFQIYVYGAGLYSFFQACVPNRNCQDSMILVDSRSAGIYLYQLTTAGTTNMITYTGGDVVALQADNINGFASTLSFWEADGDGSGGPGDSGSGGFDSFSDIPWNPNPYPSPGAASETFIGAISSVVVPIPTTTVFVTVGGAIITLNSGGTPVNALIPSTISEPNAITPTWTFNILPPTSVPSITFTAPLSGAETFSTVVPSPTTGAVTITGPAGAVWMLTAGSSGASILGTLPTSIGISGGTTPTAVPPVGWLGPWTDPIFPHSVTTMQPVQPESIPATGCDLGNIYLRRDDHKLPIPTATKTISAGGATIVLNSGGTPVNGPLASQCTEVAGILPSWSQDIIPPPGASIITFTGPLTSTPTWLTTVPVPPKSDSPEETATGPPGDKNRCNDLNFWSLLFGLIIHPCLPLDVGIIGGITPVPIPPPGWSGPWTNPIPRPTPPPPGGGDDDQTTSQASSSSSSDAACPTKPANLDLPDDDDNADWDDQGSDPDQRRRDIQIIPRASVPAARRSLQEFNATYDLQRINATHSHLLFRRNRHIKIANCDALEIDSPTNVLLGAGNYITLDPRRANWETILISQAVGGKPAVAGETNRYISQFTNAAPINADCDWIRENLFDYVRADGTTMGIAIIRTIDSASTNTLLLYRWVDKPLNQAKSNVVNRNSADAAHPPQLVPLRRLLQDGEFDDDAQEIYSAEDFLRHLAAVGQYFGGTAPIFREIALRVQNFLSEITPSDVIDDDSSLPLQFNNWLTNLVNTYPNGCTSRGQNAWNYYQRPVPACYELFSHGTNLLPPPPQSPRCNVPGTAGAIAYVQSFGGANGAVQIMGSGNTDFYAGWRLTRCLILALDRTSSMMSPRALLGTLPPTSRSCATVWAHRM
ncbi:hypothetical protein B0H14DRAFT_2831454 [Mycena olivaceomarginata]|nr:hypothetical protein B0H14DRAFT_2831454 [Mycena olivaceomarginata]